MVGRLFGIKMENNVLREFLIGRTNEGFHRKNELFQESIATFWGYNGLNSTNDRQ